MAFDPATYLPTLAEADRSALGRLVDGEALLGETEASLRHIGIGGTLTFGAVTLRVSDIVGDELIGAAEVAVTRTTGEQLGVTTDKYALLVHHGDRVAIEQAARSLLPAGIAIRFRAPGETPYLRYGDAVLPQALVKARFGEFAWRPVPGRPGDFEEDPGWTAANIVRADLPILGTIQCHRSLVPAIRGALTDLEAENLGFLVDPAAFQGCWVPRLTRSGSGISRHAWGAAVDVNFGANRTGLSSTQDRRLVAAMARWGLTWGGNWLVPDPAHFEYLTPPPA
jgi:hypothetical protein